MNMQPILSLIVPRSWNAADALTAVHILQETIEAIWFVHGDEMHRCQDLYGSSPSSFPQNWLVQRQERRMQADDDGAPKDPDLPF